MNLIKKLTARLWLHIITYVYIWTRRANYSIEIIIKKFLQISFTYALVFPVVAQEFLGNYTTKPELAPSFNKPHSEKEKIIIEKLTWKLTIEKNQLFITMNPKGEEIEAGYSYKERGKFLLAVDPESNPTKYIPLYIENLSVIHGLGTTFYRYE